MNNRSFSLQTCMLQSIVERPLTLQQLCLHCMQASWLTPSEIFTPYYGRAIANFILDKHSQMAEPGSKLSIVEIGGGTGTLARDVLDHIRSAAPQSYAACSYTSVEISPQLAQAQQRTVAETAGHASRYEVLGCPTIRGEGRATLLVAMQTSEPVPVKGWAEGILMHGVSVDGQCVSAPPNGSRKLFILPAGGVQGCWGACRMAHSIRPDIYSHDGGPGQLSS